jgi:large subunit ribosomal protein L22
METRATTKYIPVSPQKVRLVVDLIRGKGVEEALNILKFIPKRSAGFVAKTVRTAVANAENTQSVDVDRLFVKLANSVSSSLDAGSPCSTGITRKKS